MNNKRFASTALLAAVLTANGAALALTCTSNANGNWSAAGTWTGCGGGTPGAADNVIITGNDTVTVNVNSAANSITFAANTGSTNLTHNAGISLTVGTGGVIINGSTSANRIHSWNINAGSATVNGAVTLNQGSSTARIARIVLSSGSLDINGNLTMTNTVGAAATAIVMNIAPQTATFVISGNFTLSNGLGTLTSGTGSTVTYDSAAAATVATGSAISYRNLTINKAGGTATTTSAPAAPRAFTVLGNLNVQAGTLDITGVTAAVTGTTTVGGTLAISSTGGTKTFTGNVTVNGGGTWNNSSNEIVAMGGSLTNDGTFTSGTGQYTFQTTAAQQWAGTSGLTFSGNVVVSATRTNNTTTTIVGNLSGASTLTNAASQTLNIGGNATITTLNATAVGNTVNYNGSAAQTAKNTTYYHLKIENVTGPVTLPGNIIVLGDLTDNGGFDPVTGSRTVTFQGTSAQNLLGTAASTSFFNATLNNTNGLTLSHNMNVSNLLTLTSGRITTGASKVFISNGSAITGAGANAFVVGNLEKAYPTGSNVSRIFEVGTETGGNKYAPVALVFASVSGAGSVTVATVGTDHPDIGASVIDDTLSVNRYWTITNGGVGFTTYDATFTFVNPGDLDAGVDPVVFIALRYTPPLPAAGSWNATTIGSRSATTNQITGETGFGDFAIGTRFGVTPGIGRFNAYDTTTPAGQVTGVIKTKIAGAAFNLDIIAITAAGTAIRTGYTGTVRVELLDASDNSGVLDANACRTSWPVIQTLSPDPVFVAADSGRRTITITETNAWPQARIRIWNFPTGTLIGCSTDAFAIRPNAFTAFSVSDDGTLPLSAAAGTARALNDVTFGTVRHKAGRPVSVRANAANAAGTPAITTNYTGSPTATLSACAGAACTATFGTLTLNTAFAAGQLVTDIASYSEVGSFGLKLIDDTFAAVDSSDGSSMAEMRIESALINVGRFVPDHFAVTPTAPTLATGCAAGSFTFVGQAFNYATAPVFTVQARNFSGNPTTLYTDNTKWWRITDSSLAGKAYTAASGTLDTTGVPGTDPVILDAGAGSGSLTFSSGTGLFFARTTPVLPFDAEISLAINIIDADGVVYESPIGTPANPARFGTASAGNGIAFSSGKQMRFGRLRIGNANGSQLLPLKVQMQAQYWASTGAGNSFIANTDDSCTALVAANIALGNYQKNLNACETSVTVGSFAGGRSAVQLSAPGNGNNGSVDLTANLGAGGSGTTCVAGAVTPVTGANRAYLQGNWSGGAYDQNPTARAAFGVYRGAEEVIHIRENF